LKNGRESLKSNEIPRGTPCEVDANPLRSNEVLRGTPCKMDANPKESPLEMDANPLQSNAILSGALCKLDANPSKSNEFLRGYPLQNGRKSSPGRGRRHQACVLSEVCLELGGPRGRFVESNAKFKMNQGKRSYPIKAVTRSWQSPVSEPRNVLNLRDSPTD
jgi:hypothetical protein